MADYRAISTGNYSDLTGWEVSTDNGLTWSAATSLPVIGDKVYANNFIKNVDVDSFADFYSNRSATGVNAGGRFNLQSGVTMVGDVLHRHTDGVECCIFKNSALNGYIVGNVYGSDLNIQSGNSSSSSLFHSDAIRVSSGQLFIIGEVRSGLTNGNNVNARPSGGVRVSQFGFCSIVGDAICEKNITGIHAVRTSLTFNLSDLSVIQTNAVISGRATGNGANGNAGFGITVSEIEGRNQDCIVTSKFIMPTTNSPTWVNCKAQTGAPIQIEVYDELNQPVLCNPLFAQGQANPSDVRNLTVYANGALTGTLAVPPAGSVSLGVPVDNTTGTGSVTSAEIRNLILPSILSVITAP